MKHAVRLFLLLLCCSVAHAQRGLMRSTEQFYAKDDSISRSTLEHMTREMSLIQDLPWTLPKTSLKPYIGFESTQSDAKDGGVKLTKQMAKHIEKYTNKHPLTLTLSSKRGKYGLLAGAVLPNGTKLRGYWREATDKESTRTPQMSSSSSSSMFQKLKNGELPYDDAVRSRLFTVEFELQLPPLVRGGPLPSVLYQIPLEKGSLNPKAYTPRYDHGNRLVLLPQGRPDGSSVATKPIQIDCGKLQHTLPIHCHGTTPKGGIIDPSWSKGKAIFYNPKRTRSSGI